MFVYIFYVLPVFFSLLATVMDTLKSNIDGILSPANKNVPT